MNSKQLKSGFTIIELLIVIVVIGILAVLAVVSYSSIKTRVVDSAVVSDVERVNIAELKYNSNNGTAGKTYYSGNGTDSSLDFSPTNGNVIDVVSDSTGYCIRGYNIGGSYSTIANSYTKESTPGICNTLSPSDQAIIDSSGVRYWKSVEVGFNHGCGIADNGKAYCWGRGTEGQIGNGHNDAQNSTPQQVSMPNELASLTFKSISIGYFHTCAIASNDKAYCWGSNVLGELGRGYGGNTNTPVAVETSGLLSGLDIKSIAAGMIMYNTCVIASNNNAYCWGEGGNGANGNGTFELGAHYSPIAVTMPIGLTFSSIDLGGGQVCAIASNSQAYCWGANSSGTVGDGTSGSNKSTPVRVLGPLSGVSINKITAGGNHTCAITNGNSVYCWGSNGSGQLGDNTITGKTIPTAIYTGGVLSGLTEKTVEAGSMHTCVIASNNRVYCWGNDFSGQLGDGDSGSGADKPAAVAVDTGGLLSGKGVVSLSLGGTTLASTSLTMYTVWGYNGDGRLGDGTLNSTSVPVRLAWPD